MNFVDSLAPVLETGAGLERGGVLKLPYPSDDMITSALPFELSPALNLRSINEIHNTSLGIVCFRNRVSPILSNTYDISTVPPNLFVLRSSLLMGRLGYKTPISQITRRFSQMFYPRLSTYNPRLSASCRKAPHLNYQPGTVSVRFCRTG